MIERRARSRRSTNRKSLTTRISETLELGFDTRLLASAGGTPRECTGEPMSDWPVGSVKRMVSCLITFCGFWSTTDSVRDGGAYHRKLHPSGTDCPDLPGGAFVGRSVSLAHYSAGASPHLASGLTACGAEGREPSGNTTFVRRPTNVLNLHMS